MAYTDEQGKRYFVLPVRRYGNILLAPQPSRGWTENADHLYHDTSTSPSHQYIAFYLWLLKEFKVDALLQFGTHGSHEWLSGKEAGMHISDPPEYLIQDLPNLYAYIMDDVGEGTQAQRRGMAIMISHLTPPFDKSGLNPELRELKSRLDAYQSALQKSPLLAEGHLEGINELAESMGIFKDVGIDRLDQFHGDMEHPEHEHDHSAHDFSADPTPELVHKLQHYLEEIAQRQTAFGLHTLGVPPEERFIQSTAEAIVALDETLDESQRGERIEEIKNLIRLSARRELDAIVTGLAGGYIEAGVGGDPLRTPSALPTGRNFYSFDPRRIPAETTYRVGARLAQELIDAYAGKHGEAPDKLTFTLWGVETMRHEGVQEAQIMYLMGVRPVWDERGIVRGMEAIPREELGRPRIDVTIIPSGMHRDLYSNVLVLLDEAVSVAQAQDEPDNALRNNTVKTQEMLEQRGIEQELAARMAAVRMFTVPSGAYGSNLSPVAERSDTWENEQQVADVYFMRMSHMYGQGFWGDSGKDSGQAEIGRELLKTALSGTKMTVHSRASNVYQVLTGDDPFQSFGGVTMAVRAVDGKSPEVYISNLENIANMKQETLERYMGREMRTSYLNPEWIKEMQQEGYAGAKHMNMVVQNLWGWQVTVPEAVGNEKWNEMYETYVNDRYDLDMEQFFREAGNLWALQALMTRMLEAVRKGYWEADQAIVDDLGQKVSELIQELQIQCSAEDCHDPILTKLVQANLVPVPGVAMVQAAAMATAPQASSESAAPADTSANPGGREQVQGYAMEEVAHVRPPEFEQTTRWIQIAGFLLLCLALAWGFFGGAGTRERTAG
jgi:cobaltochelatase CobN